MNDCRMWFGTQDYSKWIETPLSGASANPAAWGNSGTLINGGGYSMHSFNSHKEYDFSWSNSSTQEQAQEMMSFFSGTYGRGKLYFQDPLSYSTNVLPARLADPSITCDFEGPQLVPGVDPLRVSASGGRERKLPVSSAQFGLGTYTNTPPASETSFEVVAENLFTNPNLVGDGTWPEVRRNLVPINPSMRGSGVGWDQQAGVVQTSTPDGLQIDVTSSLAANAILVRTSSPNNTTPVVGEGYRGSFEVSVPLGFPSVTVWTTIYWNVEGTGVVTPTTINAGETKRVESGFGTAGALHTSARVWLRAGTALPTGARFTVREALLEKSPSLGPYFDGSTSPETAVGVSQPGHYRWRWLGAENASESVMESDGTWAEVASNLFPNPNLVGDGTWAEVRRNLVTNPSFEVNTAGWTGWLDSAIARSTSESFHGTASLQVTAGAPVTGNPSARTTLTGMTIGEVYSVSARVFIPSGQTGTPRVTPSVAGVGYGVGSSTIGVWVSVTQTFTATQTSHFLNFGADAGQSIPAGFVYFLDQVQVEKGAALGPYFDGNITQETAVGVDQPEDFRWRWLGAENASESVMEIENVRGLTSINCVAGVSAREGNPTVRLIPNSSSAASYTTFIMPSGPARSGGTILATAIIDAPLTGSTSQPARLQVNDPYQNSEATPNESGVYPKRFVYDALTSSYRVILRHGGAQGSGDVWWTDIGLFAGNYTGEVFSGDTTPETAVGVTQPEDFRWRWSGTPDASTSIMEIERVRDLTPNAAVAGVSTWEGEPAVRLIPTTASNLSHAVFAVPEAARAGGTVVATVHLSKPLTGGLHVYSRRAITVAPDYFGDAPVNAAGSYPQRLEYGALGSLYQVRLFNGAAVGSGDVWWTDIGLFAGEYDGPAFSGDTGLVSISGQQLQTKWTGAENNSVSQAGFYRASLTEEIRSTGVFVPVPDGMTLNMGAFYSTTSPTAGVYYTPLLEGGKPTNSAFILSPLEPNSGDAFPNSYSKKHGEIGVLMWIGKLEESTATVTVNAIHARLSPAGVTMPDGPPEWVGGQGNEGVRFLQPPTYIMHTGVNGGQVEFAASFTESIH